MILGVNYTVCQEDPLGGDWSQNPATVTDRATSFHGARRTEEKFEAHTAFPATLTSAA